MGNHRALHNFPDSSFIDCSPLPLRLLSFVICSGSGISCSHFTYVPTQPKKKHLSWKNSPFSIAIHHPKKNKIDDPIWAAGERPLNASECNALMNHYATTSFDFPQTRCEHRLRNKMFIFHARSRDGVGSQGFVVFIIVEIGKIGE